MLCSKSVALLGQKEVCLTLLQEAQPQELCLVQQVTCDSDVRVQLPAWLCMRFIHSSLMEELALHCLGSMFD